jgi:zinc transporter ZupT
MVLLAASLAMLLLGPLLYRLVGARATALAVLDTVSVVSVGVLVVLFILPESIAENGPVALVPMLVGLLLPTVIERGLGRVAAQAHRAVLGIVIAGLSVHQVLDGIALGLPDGGHSHALPAAVVLHQLPAGLVIWRLLRASRGERVAAWVMGVLALGIIAGFVAGDALAVLDFPGLGLFTALVAGSLLHVFVHTWDSERHAH